MSVLPIQLDEIPFPPVTIEVDIPAHVSCVLNCSLPATGADATAFVIAGVLGTVAVLGGILITARSRRIQRRRTGLAER